MTRPTFDTSGLVGPVNLPNGTQALALGWAHLSPFEQGYVEALFATAKEMNFAHWGAPLTFSMLSPEALARIMADCERWRRRYPQVEDTRRQGVRFWELRQAQHVSRPDFPPLTPFLSEVGKIHLREAQS